MSAASPGGHHRQEAATLHLQMATKSPIKTPTPSCRGVLYVSLRELTTATMAGSSASTPSSGMRACQRRLRGLVAAGESRGVTTPPPPLSQLALFTGWSGGAVAGARRVPAASRRTGDRGTTQDSSRRRYAA